MSDLILEIQDYNKLYKQDLKKQCNILESMIGEKLKVMYGVDSDSQLSIFEAVKALEVRCNEIREELKQIMYKEKNDRETGIDKR